MALNDPTLDQLEIETGGVRLEGWLTSSVTRGVERCPSGFSISLTERFPNSFTQAIVVPGSTCKVFLGSDLALTGYIDSYVPSYDGHTHFVRISGRSNVEDIVDSSFLVKESVAWQVSGKLKQAVTKILQDFPNVGLTMSDADDVEIPRPYNITVGETVWQVIETLCRMCSRLLWDDENGDLVIGQVGKEQAGALVEGKNVEAAAAKIDWCQRYNSIQVINSTYIPGSLNNTALATATDDQIRATRMKAIVMDADLGPDNINAKNRAYWLMNRLKGRSLMVEVTVTGWRNRRGGLWKPNTVAKVSLPTLKVETDLVIAECTWTRDDTGTKTLMTLMPSGALQPEPFVARYLPGQGSSATGGGTTP